VDRRRISARMTRLRGQLKKIGMRKNVIRLSRGDYPIVALVGYTNAGKSTLMNALTGARTVVRNQLFATLDTTTRKLEALTDGGSHAPILIVDTVGFIRKLPHHLIESFRATLADIGQAQLYLHVVDVSHPAFLEQLEVAETTLRAIDNAFGETIHVFNKIDKVEDGLLKGVRRRYPEALLISASKLIGIEEVKERIEKFFYGSKVRVQIKLPAADGKSIAMAKKLLKGADESFDDGKCILNGVVDTVNLKHLETLSHAVVTYLH
jgi:GTP-binding protein HflX